MSYRVNIHDQATPAIKELLESVSGRRAHAIMGQSVRVLVREHLRKKEGEPNKQGWPKTHFYSRARERTFYTADQMKATVSVALEGFFTLVTGLPETINPVNAGALTIPARAEAYGKRAREFDDLEYRPLKRGRLVGMLVRKGGGSEVYYWLLSRVYPKPHADAMPTEEQITAAAIAGLAKAIPHVT